MKTCFAIMPFSKSFDDINEIIRKAARKSGLTYIRGDLSNRPGSVLAQIVSEISRASVVVADITGQNASVFYELGIAHQLLGPERVVIITQATDEKQAYDVHQFQQLTYSHTNEGREELRSKLPGRLKVAASSNADHDNWQIIRGQYSRTKMIVKDLRRLIDGAKGGSLDHVTIRIVAGLGSLSISDHERAGPTSGNEYFEALLEERNTLREALLLGARLKAVLNPPRRFALSLWPATLRMRYQRMIGLLQGRSDITNEPQSARKDIQAMRQCEFTLSPVPTSNLFIIGNTIAFEGMKRGGDGGFEMTHWETSQKELRLLIEQFDRFFHDSQQDMRHTHPPDGRLLPQLQAFFREACAVEKRRKPGAPTKKIKSTASRAPRKGRRSPTPSFRKRSKSASPGKSPVKK